MPAAFGVRLLAATATRRHQGAIPKGILGTMSALQNAHQGTLEIILPR